jgi:TRAP-type mannitol/chloroaromatic compound transport system substrate-binding protein
MLSAKAKWSSSFSLLELSYQLTVGGLSGFETYMWMTRGGGQAFLEKMIAPYNVVAINGTYYPPETFLWTNKPLKTLADIKGMKIRTAGDDGKCSNKWGWLSSFWRVVKSTMP